MESQLADTAEKQPSIILHTLYFVLYAFTYVCVQSKPLNAETPTVHKADRFPSPDSA